MENLISSPEDEIRGDSRSPSVKIIDGSSKPDIFRSIEHKLTDCKRDSVSYHAVETSRSREDSFKIKYHKYCKFYYKFFGKGPTAKPKSNGLE